MLLRNIVIDSPATAYAFQNWRVPEKGAVAVAAAQEPKGGGSVRVLVNTPSVPHPTTPRPSSLFTF